MDMDYSFNKTARWTFYTAGAILVFIGTLSILNPLITLISTAVSMGVGFLLAGANYLVPYFSMKKHPQRPKWFLLLGVADMLFGVLFITKIGLAILALSTLLGAWMLLTGALRLYASLLIRSTGAPKWWIMTVSAVLTLILSFLLLSNPTVEGLFLSTLVGVSLVAAGALFIAEGRMIYPAKPIK
ncbi:MAG: DUF308 domain-containing protein [Synergistaceae bacterium]|jgi:uncharacterized membrane protein HdeD (DUF308 family)|nr:DUF308 domain-containing protein [Synergistaceae bacterium]